MEPQDRDIRDRARRAAREFKGGRGRAWPWVGDREMIIDAEVMDQVRYAYAANPDYPMTPAEMMAFRKAFVEEITKAGFV